MYLWLALLLAAQQGDMPNMPGMNHQTTPAAPQELEEASGTSLNPASSPMNMAHFKAGGWRFMAHGILFATEIQQTGPRGGDKLASVNWFMGDAEHSLGGGTLSVRIMLSLEPAT